MADQTRSLVRSSTSGPSGRTIVAFVASYLCSYVLLGLFLVLEQVHSRQAYGVYVDPLFGNPAYIDVTRPYDGLYVMAVSLMLFAPVAFGGFLLGWISGRRSVELAILLAFLYVFPGLMLALWDFPSSSLVGWDVPSDESARSLLTLYLAYLTMLSSVGTVPAAYLASRIRNRISLPS